MFPNDTIRLLYSCMVCETLDQVTIRMNYIYDEAEVNCNCCGHQWKTKVTLADKQAEVYKKWKEMIKKKMGIRTRAPPVFCESCGEYHAAEPREAAAPPQTAYGRYRAAMGGGSIGAVGQRNLARMRAEGVIV